MLAWNNKVLLQSGELGSERTCDASIMNNRLVFSGHCRVEGATRYALFEIDTILACRDSLQVGRAGCKGNCCTAEMLYFMAAKCARIETRDSWESLARAP